MTYREWLPSLWAEQKDGEDNPFRALKKQVDSLFEDFDAVLPEVGGAFRIRSNVSETDKEIRVTAELPGMREKDIDISVSGDRIIIKGEKKSEKDEKKEEKGRTFHRVERSSGSFQRSLTLPFEIDAEKVSAEVKNGVLTVKIDKPPEVVKQMKKIEIKSA